jgi:hypothetical protein
MPQTAIEEARSLGDHLKRISAESTLKTDGLRAKLEFGWAELSHDNEDSGADLLSRASVDLQTR